MKPLDLLRHRPVWAVGFSRSSATSGRSFDLQIDGVVVQFTAGIASTSVGIADSDKAAMKLMISHWYEHRSEVEDAASYPVPMAVDALISATDPGIYA